MPDYGRHETVYVFHKACGTPVELRWMHPKFFVVGTPPEEQVRNVVYCPKCECQVPTSALSSPGPYSAVWPNRL